MLYRIESFGGTKPFASLYALQADRCHCEANKVSQSILNAQGKLSNIFISEVLD